MPIMSVDLSRESDTTPRLDSEVVIDSVVNPFEILNPYDVSVLPGPILQIQDVNLDASSRVQPVEAFVIKALSAAESGARAAPGRFQGAWSGPPASAKAAGRRH